MSRVNVARRVVFATARYLEVRLGPHANTPAPAPPGVVYLVGAGPGDPGLITVRGARLLESADVVVYDYLANPELLRRHVPPGAERIYVGKKAASHSMTQAEINALLVEK